MSPSRSRYAILTVDTEALPKRAAADHVNRLIWGRHEEGTAGIREICAIGDEFKARHVFFVDLCGAYGYRGELHEVIRWLDTAGHDVQLHAHPEYLPDDFWPRHGLSAKPRYMNQYADDARAEFVIRHFAAEITGVTGKNIQAFRAGSFRWNACTIRALAASGIPLSFNNSMAALYATQCVYSEPTTSPYLWSNGVIEVPMTERQFYPRVRRGLWAMTDFFVKHLKIRDRYPDFGKEWWRRLQFPASYGNFPSRILGPYRSNSLLVVLVHSWSLLYWDRQGYGSYRDDRRVEGYRKLVQRLARDYDVITTGEFLDLHARGKITTTHTVDLANAEVR